MTSTFIQLGSKLKHYWSLIKSLQTLLLLITGVAGFICTRCPWLNPVSVLLVAVSLLLAISGGTVLNMWYDRDIDAIMSRTCWRPLPSGHIRPREALIFGLILSAAGIGLAVLMDPLYGLVILAGLFFDVIVYTVWLKRRSAWSVLWGGLSGGMPILSGRVYGIGEIEWVGLALALAVICWVPTHIMTFSMRYREDYAAARVPTFPQLYGEITTRRIIAFSSLLSIFAMGLALYGIGLEIGFVRAFALLSAGLIALAVRGLARPTEKSNFRLFKYASAYMLGSMLLMMASVLN